MNALAELVAMWRTAVPKLCRSGTTDELYAEGARLGRCADELEAATVGAHLVRWERLAEVIDELPKDGSRHRVLLEMDRFTGGSKARPHFEAHFVCRRWRVQSGEKAVALDRFLQVHADAQVMVIPLGDG